MRKNSSKQHRCQALQTDLGCFISMLLLVMRAHEDLADFSALAVVADFGYFANTNAEPRLTRR